MTAKETKLQDIIEGTKQFIIPLFQRTYSWDIKEWSVLWRDIVELCEMENPRTHFMGSMVNMPTNSVPEGVAKFLLIDGQQRLTTSFILLAVFRDYAYAHNQTEFGEEINNTLIVNQYKKGNDHFKLMPTQGDRQNFEAIILKKTPDINSKLYRAYLFFEKKLRQDKIDIGLLKKIVTTYFSIVSITLDVDDNPYLVFESLNSKGQPLSPADLIRNYFFMRVHVEQQESVYALYWQPMQEALQDDLTEFIRHFLMRDGGFVRQSDIYNTLKGKITAQNAVAKMAELGRFAKYYKCLLEPSYEQNKSISIYLGRLARLDITTAFPLLLNFYEDYSTGIISDNQFVDLLKTLENYLIRRLVSNIASNQLNKIFPEIYKQLILQYKENYVLGLKMLLQTKGYPRDEEFKDGIKKGKFYGGSPLNIRTKLILETIEQSFNHKETIDTNVKVTIEHIMPQTLSDWWKNHLGEDWEITHELDIHSLGNLTLTAYNSELSNDSFDEKRKILCESHFEINKNFKSIFEWNKNSIAKRSEELANTCVNIWAYFGATKIPSENTIQVTGTQPTGLWVLNENFQVQSWRDVLETTLNAIADLEPLKFEEISALYPRFVGKDKARFQSVRKLKNGYYIEVSLSAKDIQRFCQKAIIAIDLSNDDWKVSTVSV